MEEICPDRAPFDGTREDDVKWMAWALGLKSKQSMVSSDPLVVAQGIVDALRDEDEGEEE